MLSIVHLRSLITIADTGSFSEAARRLDLAQSTVSQHIARLERTLATRLIERGGAIRLTESGIATCRYARGIQRLHDRIIAIERRPGLEIGASSNIGTYLLEPVLQHLGQRGTGTVDLRIASNPDVADALDAGQIDLGLMEWWDDRPGFRASVWREEDLVVIVPPTHPWAGATALSASDLAGVPLIGGERATGTGRRLQQYFASHGVELCAGMQLGNTAVVKQAVANGLGVSIVLAAAVVGEVARGEIRAIPLTDGGIRKPLYIVHSDQIADEPTLKDFIALLVDMAPPRRQPADVPVGPGG